VTDAEWRAFPPHVLREYALLADGERGALCGPRGDLSWLCAPGWADDAVLSTVVGGGGAYSVCPVDTAVWGGYYEPVSLIWRNCWVTTTTVVECREALAFPGDPHRMIVLRRIEAVERQVRVHANSTCVTATATAVGPHAPAGRAPRTPRSTTKDDCAST
jgi:hypothetical protein